MVINIIICVVSVILMLRGAFLILKMGLLWMLHCRIIKSYDRKTHGKVVDIETQVKSDGMNITDVCIPKIKYKLEGEDEKCCQFLPSNLKSGEENNIYLYPKQYHIDDKVTILYDKGKANDMFVLPRMQLMRLLVNQFVPGCFFILSAILGLCFVFYKQHRLSEKP